MKTILILLALSQLRTPPSAPGWEPAPKPQPVVAQAAVARPRVVLLTLPGCVPCVRVKARLASLKNRKDIEYLIEDLNHWNARVKPSLRSNSAPTIFAWRDPSKPSGARFNSSVTLADIERAISGDAPQRAVAPSGASPFISINGSNPRAANKVTINGSYATVHPNTESAWREHVRWHGYADAYQMTPRQLVEAHARAHR